MDPSDGLCHLFDATDFDMNFANSNTLSGPITFSELRIAKGLTFSQLPLVTDLVFPELLQARRNGYWGFFFFFHYYFFIWQVKGSSSGFNIIDMIGLQNLVFPKLTTVDQNGIAIDMRGNTGLLTISFPALTSIEATSFAIRIVSDFPTYCVSMPLLTRTNALGSSFRACFPFLFVDMFVPPDRIDIDATSFVNCDVDNIMMGNTIPDASGCTNVCCGTINCPTGICIAGTCTSGDVGQE